MAKRNPAKKRQASTAVTPARMLALKIGKEVRLRDAYVREIVDRERESSKLPYEEFAYAQVLAFGVSMCLGTLDELIDRNLNSPRDVKANVRDALRISAYELLFLEKPAHVVVDQGVELVRSVTPRAAGLANAVLRKVVKDAELFPWAEAGSTIARARVNGVPKWLCEHVTQQYGSQEADRIFEACLDSAPTYLHISPFAADEDFASDLSAQFVSTLVPVDGTVLEIGAGRGTKTILLQCASYHRYGVPCKIHTVDVHEYKQALLAERLQQMQVPAVTTHTGDARNLDAIAGLPPAFDAVFIDAPCSGTGTLRRHPEIRWHLQPEGVDELAQLQLDMLQSGAAYVRHGGSLVYATCSILSEENEDVVKAFLATDLGKEFSIEPVKDLHVPPAVRMIRKGQSEQEGVLSVPQNWRITDEGFFAAVPAADGPDGHFAAVLRRR